MPSWVVVLTQFDICAICKPASSIVLHVPVGPAADRCPASGKSRKLKSEAKDGEERLGRNEGVGRAVVQFAWASCDQFAL